MDQLASDGTVSPANSATITTSRKLVEAKSVNTTRLAPLSWARSTKPRPPESSSSPSQKASSRINGSTVSTMKMPCVRRRRSWRTISASQRQRRRATLRAGLRRPAGLDAGSSSDSGSTYARRGRDSDITVLRTDPGAPTRLMKTSSSCRRPSTDSSR